MRVSAYLKLFEFGGVVGCRLVKSVVGRRLNSF